MFSQAWFVPALLCMLAWGFSRVLPKFASNHLDVRSAFIYEILGEMLVALAVLAYMGFRPGFDWKGSSYALAAGLLGGLGVYWYLLAASRGNVSQLVGITALYPIITVILGVWLLQEPLTLKQAAGVALAVVAVILVSS